jgi:hypothetical protein
VAELDGEVIGDVKTYHDSPSSVPFYEVQMT